MARANDTFFLDVENGAIASTTISIKRAEIAEDGRDFILLEKIWNEDKPVLSPLIYMFARKTHKEQITRSGLRKGEPLKAAFFTPVLKNLEKRNRAATVLAAYQRVTLPGFAFVVVIPRCAIFQKIFAEDGHLLDGINPLVFCFLGRFHTVHVVVRAVADHVGDVNALFI